MAYVPPADGFGDWATPKLLTAGPFFAHGWPQSTDLAHGQQQ